MTVRLCRDGRDAITPRQVSKAQIISAATIRTDGTIVSELVSKVPPWAPQQEYVVQKNDSLSRIAKRSWALMTDGLISVTITWIDKDANVLKPGMRLLIPGSSLINEDGRAMDYNTDRFIRNPGPVQRDT